MKKQLLSLLSTLCINTVINGMVQGNNFNNRYGTDSHIMNTSSYFKPNKSETKEKVQQPRSEQTKKNKAIQNQIKKRKYKKRTNC